MKTIRYKQDYRYSLKGDVREEGDGVADILLQRGIAEEVSAEEVSAEEASADISSTENSGQASSAFPVTTRRRAGPRERV